MGLRHSGMMAWLRLHARSGALIALFAIVLQIAGTFGHTHLSDRSVVANTGSAGATHVQSTKPIVGDATVVSDAKPSLPGGDGDALCALCLTGHLAAVGVTASEPALAYPVVYARLSALIAKAHSSSFDIDTPFWSRGPPTA